MKGMKLTLYTAPTLEKVTLAASDILLTSGEEPDEYEVRGKLNDFDTASQYQNRSWKDFFGN